MKRKCFILMQVWFACCLYGVVLASLPVSREAVLVETSSPTEVIIDATGIYHASKGRLGRKRKEVKSVGISKATEDLKKAGIYYLLYNGSDPLLSNQEERLKFKAIEAGFFKIERVKNWITYEDDLPMKKIYLNEGAGIKIVKRIKVNREQLIQSLVEQGVLQSKEDLSDIVGNPFIMVLPKAPKNSSALAFLKENKEAAHAATAIQSILTAKQYDVVIPDQQAKLSQLSQATLKGQGDTAYQLALSMGSDIYLDYDISVADAAYGTQKHSISIRAYETTTGRLLGSETGYSVERQGDRFVSIEEAVLEALNNVLSRVGNYWKKDLRRGVQ